MAVASQQDRQHGRTIAVRAASDRRYALCWVHKTNTPLLRGWVKFPTGGRRDGCEIAARQPTTRRRAASGDGGSPGREPTVRVRMGEGRRAAAVEHALRAPARPAHYPVRSRHARRHGTTGATSSSTTSRAASPSRQATARPCSTTSASTCRRRGRRHRRAQRLGQEHAAAAHRRPAAAGRRHDPIDGTPVTRRRPARRARLPGAAPAALATTLDNVAFPLELAGVADGAARRERATALLELVGVAEFARRVPAPAVGRHAPARGDRARARARPGGAAARRAVQRARCADARALRRRAARALAAHRLDRSCSSRTASPRRSSSPTA